MLTIQPLVASGDAHLRRSHDQQEASDRETKLSRVLAWNCADSENTVQTSPSVNGKLGVSSSRERTWPLQDAPNHHLSIPHGVTRDLCGDSAAAHFRPYLAGSR